MAIWIVTVLFVVTFAWSIYQAVLLRQSLDGWKDCVTAMTANSDKWKSLCDELLKSNKEWRVLFEKTLRPPLTHFVRHDGTREEFDKTTLN